MIWEANNRIFITGYGTVATSARTIWPGNSIVPVPNQLLQFSVASSNVNDAFKGTGSQEISIYGLDINFKKINLSVYLDGQNPIELPNIRFINHIETDGDNLGVIYVGRGVFTLGVPADVYELIPIGSSCSQTVKYTVPLGKIFILDKIVMDQDITVTDYTVKLCITKNGTTKIISHSLSDDIHYELKSGETITLQHEQASVSGTVYGRIEGKLEESL